MRGRFSFRNWCHCFNQEAIGTVTTWTCSFHSFLAIAIMVRMEESSRLRLCSGWQWHRPNAQLLYPMKFFLILCLHQLLKIFSLLSVLFKFQPRVRHFFCKVLQRHNSPANWPRELFKPSTDSASRLVEIEKQNFNFVFGVLCVGRQSRDVFTYFWPILPALGANQMSRCFGSSFFGN